MAGLHVPGRRALQLSARSSPKRNSLSPAVTQQHRGADKAYACLQLRVYQ